MNNLEKIKSLTRTDLHQKELIKHTDDDDLKLVNIGTELYLKLLSLPKRPNARLKKLSHSLRNQSSSTTQESTLKK